MLPIGSADNVAVVIVYPASPPLFASDGINSIDKIIPIGIIGFRARTSEERRRLRIVTSASPTRSGTVNKMEGY